MADAAMLHGALLSDWMESKPLPVNAFFLLSTLHPILTRAPCNIAASAMLLCCS